MIILVRLGVWIWKLTPSCNKARFPGIFKIGTDAKYINDNQGTPQHPRNIQLSENIHDSIRFSGEIGARFSHAEGSFVIWPWLLCKYSKEMFSQIKMPNYITLSNADSLILCIQGELIPTLMRWLVYHHTLVTRTLNHDRIVLQYGIDSFAAIWGQHLYTLRNVVYRLHIVFKITRQTLLTSQKQYSWCCDMHANSCVLNVPIVHSTLLWGTI